MAISFAPVQEAAVQFDSPEVATAGKSTKEVFRGWVVFKLLTYDFLVNNSLRVSLVFISLSLVLRHTEKRSYMFISM